MLSFSVVLEKTTRRRKKVLLLYPLKHTDSEKTVLLILLLLCRLRTFTCRGEEEKSVLISYQKPSKAKEWVLELFSIIDNLNVLSYLSFIFIISFCFKLFFSFSELSNVLLLLCSSGLKMHYEGVVHPSNVHRWFILTYFAVHCNHKHEKANSSVEQKSWEDAKVIQSNKSHHK